MRPQHLPKSESFLAAKFMPRLVYGSARVRAFLLCLEPGQGLEARVDSEELLCYVVEGRAEVTVEGEALHMSAGDFAAVRAGGLRGIAAEERTVALWIHVSGMQASDG